MYSNDGLTDLGMADRIDVDGMGAVESYDVTRFVTTFWTRVWDGRIWVRAPRLYLVRPRASITTGGRLHLWLASQPKQCDTPMLHS